MFAVLGELGIGKSAALCQLLRADPKAAISSDPKFVALQTRVIAHHICTFADGDSLSAIRFVRSFAAQIQKRYPAAALDRAALTQSDPQRALLYGVLEPLRLSGVIRAAGAEPQCVVVDSMDEALCTTSTAMWWGCHNRRASV